MCHDNVSFKIPSVLVKNLTDKIILGLPFINALYPFLVEHDGITTDPFGLKVKFKFASKTDIDIANLSYEKDSPMNDLIQEIMMSSCQCFTDDFKGISLQRDVLAEVTYSNGDIIIALQEVLARNLQFQNGTYSELPASIKLILDNLKFSFIENHCDVFQQTLRALEIHIVNLTT